jgi:hypothetical protein
MKDKSGSMKAEGESSVPETPETPRVAGDLPMGIECRRCGCRHFHVIYTRPREGGVIVRLRECRHCGLRRMTRER